MRLKSGSRAGGPIKLAQDRQGWRGLLLPYTPQDVKIMTVSKISYPDFMSEANNKSFLLVIFKHFKLYVY